MSEESQAILKLGVPKGSLEDATINLFERAGWKIRKHTRNYFPDINDPEITASLCRVQEIGGHRRGHPGRGHHRPGLAHGRRS